MIIWVDAQLSPRIARWITANFPIPAQPLRDIGLRDAEDEEIFTAARVVNAIVLTKDSDFIRLLEQHGSPPKVVWLTCGNTSDAALQHLLESIFPRRSACSTVEKIWSKQALPDRAESTAPLATPARGGPVR